jgi:hypothetical protein
MDPVKYWLARMCAFGSPQVASASSMLLQCRLVQLEVAFNPIPPTTTPIVIITVPGDISDASLLGFHPAAPSITPHLLDPNRVTFIAFAAYMIRSHMATPLQSG